MSYTRRAGNFGKQNPLLGTVGQRRPGPFQNTGGQLMMNRCYLQPGFQNKQQQQGPPPQQQQNLQAQQQFQAQLQQQEKARAAQQAMQNQQVNQPLKPIQKPPPQATPIKPQPVPNPPQQQQQHQQQQQQPQLQQQQPLHQQQQQPLHQQQQQPQQHQQPPPPKPPTNMQQAAEQMLTDQSFMAENKPATLTNSVEIPALGDGVDGTATENNVQHKARPFWMKRNGRINRAERAKRRNVRLRKLLQPKNALMIINELVGHVPFDVSETKTGNAFEDVYKAAVSIEGKDHVGYGKSKALAKTSAAEMAVRSMILNKLRITAQAAPATTEEESKEVRMEVTEENQDDVSWTHIASFAIHKLFSSWGDDGNMADMISRSNSYVSLSESNVSNKDGASTIQAQPEQKPAKKLPENAALMNPIMLLNQMHPNAKYEELGKSGTPPHIQFTIKCTVGNQSFIGTGPNKKAARKQATFEACKTLLGIEYPPDILQG
ncbi:hypothetical protein AMK59_6674, partial [Oryctes borbonicus]